MEIKIGQIGHESKLYSLILRGYFVISMFKVLVYSNSPSGSAVWNHCHTHPASVLIVFVVFCMHMHSFAGLIRRTPPPRFSHTAITDRQSDTTTFQLRAHRVQISWSIGSKKSFGHVPSVGDEPSTSCMQDEHPIH